MIHARSETPRESIRLRRTKTSQQIVHRTRRLLRLLTARSNSRHSAPVATASRMTPAAAAAPRPTFPVDLLLEAVTNPRAANGTALCTACTADAPCCRRGCGASKAHVARVTHPFRFPQGNGYFKSKPCRAAPGLGLDHALLPVTHIGGPKKGPTDSGGLWFYYAPGCSDFLWGAVLTRYAVP